MVFINGLLFRSIWGFFTGNDDGTFAPNSYITREQAFTVIARALGVSGEDYTVIDKYSDAGSISEYAKTYLAGMIAAGYLSGYEDGTLIPKANITREEFAKVLYNILM